MTEIRYPDKRQVGESYRDYAARMEGAARAAELDRDQLRAQVDAVLKLHRRGVDSSRGELVWDNECRECDQRWPCPTVRALGVSA